jgi:aryl-alcohol dehydrogenase-like predicted oxidoreductase
VVIPGARNDRQARENTAAAEVRLSREEIDRIAELRRSGFGNK